MRYESRQISVTTVGRFMKKIRTEIMRERRRGFAANNQVIGMEDRWNMNAVVMPLWGENWLDGSLLHTSCQ